MSDGNKAEPIQVTVLVADDEALLRDMVLSALEEAGFAVVIAGSGDEAIVVPESGEPAPRLLVTPAMEVVDQ